MLEQILTPFYLVTTILYVWGAIHKKIWCWYFGIAGAIIAAILALSVPYYFDFLLQIFYILAGFYGVFSWKKAKKSNEKIIRLKIVEIIVWIFVGITLSILFGYLLKYIDNQKSYLDAFTTIFAFIATYLTAKKYIENWILWIILNPIWVYMYVQYPIYAFTYFFLFIMAFVGLFKWKKDLDAYAE